MNQAIITLTQGNINNNHFYLTSCRDIFPPDSIGGSNKAQIGSRILTVRPLGGEDVKTDIDGTKNIFRKRGWVAAFFERSKAKAGDSVYIRMVDTDVFEIQVKCESK